MSQVTPDSEQALENATMALFAQLGWQTADCFEEVIGPRTDVPPERLYLGRETTSQVVLIPRLRAALRKLNPDLPAEALDLAIEGLTRNHSEHQPSPRARPVISSAGLGRIGRGAHRGADGGPRIAFVFRPSSFGVYLRTA